MKLVDYSKIKDAPANVMKYMTDNYSNTFNRTRVLLATYKKDTYVVKAEKAYRSKNRMMSLDFSECSEKIKYNNRDRYVVFNITKSIPNK